MTPHQQKLYPQPKKENFDEKGFPLLNLFPPARNEFEPYKPREFRQLGPAYGAEPAEEIMKEDQDWPSVWQTAKTFVPSAVPLPMRQSYPKKKNELPLPKHCNTELMKVVNFLHLTPGAIERHCKALKKFCTPWPEGLQTDDEVRTHFPVSYISRDYVSASPTIRDIRARTITLKVNVDDLKLNDLDKDKLVRLAAHRYDPETNILSIDVDSCPMRRQNMDYADYLLTAVYFESIKHEEWEKEKAEEDWEKFYWERSESKSKLEETYLKDPNLNENRSDRATINMTENYRQSLDAIFKKEDVENLDAYRHNVERILGIE